MYLEFFHSPYLPSASVLKPLYVWIAHELEPRLKVDEDQIICWSSNAETDRLFQQVSKRRVFAALNTLLQERVFDAELSWGQQPVNGAILTQLYTALLQDDSEVATRVKQLMTESVQRFDIPHGYALKAGWDMTTDHKLTLLLVVLPLEVESNEVLSLLARSSPLSSTQQGTWLTLEKQDPETLVEVHQDFFKEELRVFGNMVRLNHAIPASAGH